MEWQLRGGHSQPVTAVHNSLYELPLLPNTSPRIAVPQRLTFRNAYAR